MKEPAKVIKVAFIIEFWPHGMCLCTIIKDNSNNTLPIVWFHPLIFCGTCLAWRGGIGVSSKGYCSFFKYIFWEIVWYVHLVFGIVKNIGISLSFPLCRGDAMDRLPRS